MIFVLLFADQIILDSIMIDRALNFGPVQQESYYFQLIPISLTIINKECELPAKGTTYKFLVFKGQQKFDQNKLPIQATFQKVNGVPALAITSCRLNFYLQNYNKLRKQDFKLQMIQRENGQDFEVGDYNISTDELVTQFKENNKGRHEFKTNFSEDYELQFQIYVERSRMNLERNIRDNKTERINKSPLRVRKDQKPETAKKSLSGQEAEQNLTPSRDREETPSEPTPSEQNQEEKVEVKTEINEEKVEERVEVQVQAARSSRVEQPVQTPVEKAPSVKKQSSQIHQKSEKNEVQSRRSNDHVPVITTKQRQLARPDTPAEINLTESQRLLSVAPEAPVPDKQSSETKEKLFLWLFMLVSGLIMYYAMHPNKRV